MDLRHLFFGSSTSRFSFGISLLGSLSIIFLAGLNRSGLLPMRQGNFLDIVLAGMFILPLGAIVFDGLMLIKCLIFREWQFAFVFFLQVFFILGALTIAAFIGLPTA